MKQIPFPTIGLCLLLSLPVQAQDLEVIESSPIHGSANAPIDATISFTFNQSVELFPATYLVSWDDPFSAGGGPFDQEPTLSDDGRTLSFTVRHLANSDPTIYDMLGREVASLLDRQESAGRHAAVWKR